MCDAWICKEDFSNFVRRAVAMYKRKKNKLHKNFEKLRHLKFMGWDDDGFAEVIDASFTGQTLNNVVVIHTPPVFTTSTYAGSIGGTCGNTCTISLGASATAGAIIIVQMSWQNSAMTLSTLSGSNGTCTTLPASAFTDATNNVAGISGYCLPTSTGAYTVSALMAGGTFQFQVQVVQYTGQNASPIDTSLGLGNVGAGSTSVNCPTITTTINNDTVVSMGYEVSGNAQNWLAGSGTLRGTVAAFSGWQDQVKATAGSVTPNFTSAASLGAVTVTTIAIAPL